MKNNKILFFLFNFNRGGAEWVITNLANHMAQTGIHVTVFSVKNGNMFKELDQRVKVKHFSSKYSIAFLALVKELFNNKHDIIFSTQRVATIFVYFAKTISFTKTRHIVREAASNFQHTLSKKNIVRRNIIKILFRLSYSNAAKIIVNSSGTKNDLVRAGIILQNKDNVIQIDNPLDIGLINDRARANHELKLKKTGYTIVSIGRLSPEKNMALLIEAFCRFYINRIESQLVIIGDGPEKSKLLALVEQLGLKDKVIFTRQLTNPYPILKQADLFVLASKWEGFGQVLIEALALGVPCVSTRIDGGPSHILKNGKYGTLVEVNSIEALTDAISKNSETTPNRKMLKERAKAFDKRTIGEKYKKVVFNY